MSFFPTNYNPRDEIAGLMDLCEINGSDGSVNRFIIGTDGIFKDVNGNHWVGSTLVGVERMQSAINGVAPAGSMELSFFQDPEADDLITQVKALGSSFVNGQAINFYVQPLGSMEDFYSPTVAPIQWQSRVMRTISFVASGAQDRSIKLTFETWSELRNQKRRLVYDTTGHEELIGEPNVSLSLMPTVDFDEEKLFG